MIDFSKLIVTEYNDFIAGLETLDEGSKGYVYDVEEKCIYSVVIVKQVDISEYGDIYDNVDDYLISEQPDISYDYACEVITNDEDYAVALEITDDYLAVNVEKEEIFNGQ